MKYIKKDCGAYNLHIIKTDKFKTITVDVNFLSKIKKEEITIRNFVCDMLTCSSKNYPTKRLLSKKSNELYGVSVISKNSRIGNYTSFSVTANFLNEKFSEEGMLEKSMEFLFDIIFNPNVVNNKFDTISFNIVKNQIKDEILSFKDDKIKYSMLKMLSNMGDAPYSYLGYGYISDMDLINEENLYDYYKNMLKSEKVDIFVIGDVDIDNINNIVKKYVKINTKKKELTNIVISHNKINTRSKEFKDFELLNQSKLNIGIKLPELTFFESRYVMPLYNEILGGGSDSKLFKFVREKNSLCYYVTSLFNIYDNLMIIYSGINKNDYFKTVDLIKKQLAAIRAGRVTEEELNLAKKSMISSVNTIEDYSSRIISMYYTKELIGNDDIKDKILNINKVKIEDIVNLSKKIKLDTIHLLYGDE